MPDVVLLFLLLFRKSVFKYLLRNGAKQIMSTNDYLIPFSKFENNYVIFAQKIRLFFVRAVPIPTNSGDSCV